MTHEPVQAKPGSNT